MCMALCTMAPGWCKHKPEKLDTTHMLTHTHVPATGAGKPKRKPAKRSSNAHAAGKVNGGTQGSSREASIDHGSMSAGNTLPETSSAMHQSDTSVTDLAQHSLSQPDLGAAMASAHKQGPAANRHHIVLVHLVLFHLPARTDLCTNAVL